MCVWVCWVGGGGGGCARLEDTILRFTNSLFSDKLFVSSASRKRRRSPSAGAGLTSGPAGTAPAPNSKHWFMTSFLQPLPYLGTPYWVPENCQLSKEHFCCCCCWSSKFVTNNSNMKTRRVIYSRQQSLHQRR